MVEFGELVRLDEDGIKGAREVFSNKDKHYEVDEDSQFIVICPSDLIKKDVKDSVIVKGIDKDFSMLMMTYPIVKHPPVVLIPNKNIKVNTTENECMDSYLRFLETQDTRESAGFKEIEYYVMISVQGNKSMMDTYKRGILNALTLQPKEDANSFYNTFISKANEYKNYKSRRSPDGASNIDKPKTSKKKTVKTKGTYLMELKTMMSSDECEKRIEYLLLILDVKLTELCKSIEYGDVESQEKIKEELEDIRKELVELEYFPSI